MMSLFNPIKTAFQGIKRHLAMSISCIGAISLTLIMISLIMVVSVNVDNFTQAIEQDLKIRVKIDKVASNQELLEVEAALEQIEEIKTYNFSSKEEELSILIEENGQVFERYRDYNPLNDVYVLEAYQASDIEKICEEVSTINWVEDVDYGGSTIKTMIDIFESVRESGYILVAALSFVALFLVINMIKMSVSTRKNEIAIMRFVGASNTYIKIPFILEGIIIGLLGSIVPIALTIIVYQYLYKIFNGQIISSMLVLKEPIIVLQDLSLILLASGVVVGLIGSMYALGRYLRWKR